MRDKIRKSEKSLLGLNPPFYGVIWSDNDPLNLIIKKKSGKGLLTNSPIFIIFDPIKGKIIFESKEFVY